jgi:hypothetical protein
MMSNIDLFLLTLIFDLPFCVLDLLIRVLFICLIISEMRLVNEKDGLGPDYRYKSNFLAILVENKLLILEFLYL